MDYVSCHHQFIIILNGDVIITHVYDNVIPPGAKFNVTPIVILCKSVIPSSLLALSSKVQSKQNPDCIVLLKRAP